MAPIEAYGREHYPKGDGFDQTQTILDLVSKGLGLNGLEPSVIQNVKQSVEERLALFAIEQQSAIASLKSEMQPVLDAHLELEVLMEK